MSMCVVCGECPMECRCAEIDAEINFKKGYAAAIEDAIADLEKASIIYTEDGRWYVGLPGGTNVTVIINVLRSRGSTRHGS